MTELVYWRGALRPADARSASCEARRLATGEGLFETLLVEDAAVRDIPAHVDRLLAAAQAMALGIREGRSQLVGAVRAVGASTTTAGARLRITACEGADAATVMVTATPYAPPSSTESRCGVEVTAAREQRVRRADETRQVKSLAWRRQGQLLVEGAGAYDVLLLNDAGRVAEGARSNVVVRRGRSAVTPPLSEGCLAGTVRRRLLESGAVREAELSVDELLAGGEVVLTNSLVGVVAVARIDAVSCRVAGLAAELRAAWTASRQ